MPPDLIRGGYPVSSRQARSSRARQRQSAVTLASDPDYVYCRFVGGLAWVVLACALGCPFLVDAVLAAGGLRRGARRLDAADISPGIGAGLAVGNLLQRFLVVALDRLITLDLLGRLGWRVGN